MVFDTNAMYTSAPNFLVSSDTRNLIQTNSNHPDLQIAWHVPEIVVLERHHQMLDNAQQLLPAFQKINAILGLNVELPREKLSPMIGSVIDSELSTLNLRRMAIDPTRVDWNGVIRSAAFRTPPFETGKTEKGFRDAMVLEAFMQLVESAPTSAARCRITLVTNDTLLTAAAKARIAAHSNAEVLPGLEELRNLINTLISAVDEDFVKDLREKARKLFFDPGDKATLYYREEIRAKIEGKFTAQLQEVPSGAVGRDDASSFVTSPRFLRKDGQRVHWATQIRINCTAYRYEAAASSASTFASTGISLGDLMSYNTERDKTGIGQLIVSNNSGLGKAAFTVGGIVPTTPVQTADAWNSLLISPPPVTKVTLKKGTSIFDVAWSATIGSHKKLIRPTIDDISFVETTWED